MDVDDFLCVVKEPIHQVEQLLLHTNKVDA